MRKQSGSFVLLPLKRLQRKLSTGLLGIDTIREKKEKAFVQHEVQFYEGIASALADTLTFVDFERNMMKILQRFIYWCQQRCSNVSRSPRKLLVRTTCLFRSRILIIILTNQYR